MDKLAQKIQQATKTDAPKEVIDFASTQRSANTAAPDTRPVNQSK